MAVLELTSDERNELVDLTRRRKTAQQLATRRRQREGDALEDAVR